MRCCSPCHIALICINRYLFSYARHIHFRLSETGHPPQPRHTGQLRPARRGTLLDLSLIHIFIDKTLQAVQGCHVTDASISATKEGAVELTGTLTGCRVLNARPSSVGAEAQASAASIVVEDAKVFFTGQKIQNTTKSDDNSGKGYAVTAVDERTNKLTVAPRISGAWAVDDVVTWWMPYGPALGNELENADSVIRIDGTAGKMRSCTIKFSTPTEFTDELGDRFPGQPIDTMRALSLIHI